MAYGVDLGDALLYVGYELIFVVGPGWLVYRAVSGSPGRALRQIAMGWALGYVLEVLAFMLTAALDVRPLFTAYPLAVGVAALAARARQPPAAPGIAEAEALSRQSRWLLVAVCLAAIGYFAVAYFPTTPLPGTASVSYYQDHLWTISVAADAKHHWPIQDPNVLGQPLPYHYFVNVDLAAASQVTGLALPLIFFRLSTLALGLLLVLELAVAGRSLTGSINAGLIAACLVFFIGEMQMDTRGAVHAPFLGFFFGSMLVSPSFLFGLVIFVPLITLLGEQFSARPSRIQPGIWLLILLFMIGASDAKIVILPLVLGALVVYAIWRWLVERRVPVAVWLAGGSAALVSAVVYLLQYRGHSSSTTLDLRAGTDVVKSMAGVLLIKHDVARSLPAFPGKSVILSAGGAVLGFVGLLAAQFVGLVWIVRRNGWRWDRWQAWLGSLGITGLIGLIAVRDPSNGNFYLLWYGVVAGCILSAAGLWLGWTSRPRLAGSHVRKLAAMWLMWLCALVVLLAAPRVFTLFSGATGEGDMYTFWYGGLVITLVLLWAGARVWLGPSRWHAAALVCAGVLSVGAIDTPAKYLSLGLIGTSTPTTNGSGLTPALYRSLVWVRDHTPSSAVVAINDPSPTAFVYSAITERRMFLGGWAYSQRARELGYAEVIAGVNPFEDRLRLNDAAVVAGSSAALEQLSAHYGVQYLVVDEVNGPAVNLAALLARAAVVYRSGRTFVLRLMPDAAR